MRPMRSSLRFNVALYLRRAPRRTRIKRICLHEVVGQIDSHTMSFTYAYPRPAVSVDSIVFLRDSKKLSVLLIQRKNGPYKGYWAFPGGFVEMKENLEVAAARELEEETGLKGVKLTQFHTFGDVGRDPRGRVITVMYIGTTSGRNAGRVKASSDAANVDWFDVRLPPPLAFDHAIALRMAIKRIKDK